MSSSNQDVVEVLVLIAIIVAIDAFIFGWRRNAVPVRAITVAFLYACVGYAAFTIFLTACALCLFVFSPRSISITGDVTVDIIFVTVGFVSTAVAPIAVAWGIWTLLRAKGWWPYRVDEGLAPVTAYSRDTALLSSEDEAKQAMSAIKRYESFIDLLVRRFRKRIGKMSVSGSDVSDEELSELVESYKIRLVRVACTAVAGSHPRLARWRILKEARRLHRRRRLVDLQSSLVYDHAFEQLALMSRSAFASAELIVVSCGAPTPQWETAYIVAEMLDLKDSVRNFNRSCAERMFEDGALDAAFVHERGFSTITDRIDKYATRLGRAKVRAFNAYLDSDGDAGRELTVAWSNSSVEDVAAEALELKARKRIFKLVLAAVVLCSLVLGLVLGLGGA